MTPDDRRHGTRAGYLAGCHEPCCGDPHRRYVKRYRLNAARNGGYVTVEAAPTQLHIAALLQHMSYGGIGQASGVSASAIRRLHQGLAKRTRPDTARRILAVRSVSDAGRCDVNAIPAQRMLQALAAIGYTFAELARMLTTDDCRIGRERISVIAHGRVKWIESAWDQRIRALYNKVALQVPQPAGRWQRAGSTRRRRYALAREWASALAWDDVYDLTAAPSGTRHASPDPDVDEAAVQRRMAGDTTVPITKAERVEVVRRLTERGMSQLEIVRHTGITRPDRYTTREAA